MNKIDSYFEFIRYALNPKGDMPKDVAKMDWEGFFQFEDEQGILGLMYDGRWKVYDGREKGEDGFVDDLTLEWGFAAQQIEEQNKAVNVAAVKLLKSLKEQGFDGCILKGQGNGLLYPKPYRRTPGDIDVWVKCDGRGKMDDVRRVIRFVKDRNPEARAIYHHIDGGEIDGVEVEVHYRPSFMNNLIHNRRLQKWFEQMADEQFGHYVELPDGVGAICVPTMDFNTVYLLAHVYHHLLHEGIGLRQVIDYFYLLKTTNYTNFTNFESHTDRTDLTDLRETLQSLGLWKIAGAVMWVLSEVLGLEEEYFLCPRDPKLGRKLMEETIIGGNFGVGDRRNYQKVNETRLHRYFRKSSRVLSHLSQYPREVIWAPYARLEHFFWRLFLGYL